MFEMSNKLLIISSILTINLCVAVAAVDQQFDLVLGGGIVHDYRNNIDGVFLDIGITDGVIAAVAPTIDPSLARKYVDVSGLLVTPGTSERFSTLRLR